MFYTPEELPLFKNNEVSYLIYETNIQVSYL